MPPHREGKHHPGDIQSRHGLVLEESKFGQVICPTFQELGNRAGKCNHSSRIEDVVVNFTVCRCFDSQETKCLHGTGSRATTLSEPLFQR